MMRGEDDASLTKLKQPRHHVAGDVVRAQPVDDDEELCVTGSLRAAGILGGGVHRQADRREREDEEGGGGAPVVAVVHIGASKHATSVALPWRVRSE